MKLKVHKRVYVAEDDPEMRRLVADTLRGEGLDVVEVPDGGRLLVQVAAQFSLHEPPPRFDLLVTDIRMPVCNGLDIVQGLRDARWKVPVVLMTAFGDDETRWRAESMGALLLDKPFSMADLRHTVRKALATC